MFHRPLAAAGQSHSAKTVEVFWLLILVEGTSVLLFPHPFNPCLDYRRSRHKRQIISGSLVCW
jgi:hypothetical protein